MSHLSEEIEFPEESGAYELKEKLAETNFSEVWRVSWKGQDYVMKKIDTEVHEDLTCFLREIRTMASLDHPHLMPLYGCFVEGDHIYLIMPLMKTDLLRYCREKKGLSEEEILPLLKQIVVGLQFMHERGVVHRDIKCSNIMMGEDGNIKVTDFGTNNTRSHCRTFTGTVCWMAPEIVEMGEGGYDEKVDTWSLGITLMEMIKTVAPYYNCQPMQVLMRIMKDPPPKLEDLPNAVELRIPHREYSSKMLRLIADCTQRDPATRPSMSEILIRLEKW